MNTKSQPISPQSKAPEPPRIADELLTWKGFALWLRHHLSANVIHRSTGKGGHDGDGNSWSAVAIPEWDVRQKLEAIDTLAALSSPSPAKTDVEAGSQPDRQPQLGTCVRFDYEVNHVGTALHLLNGDCVNWKPVVAAPAESPAPPESNYLCSRCMKPVPENVPCPYCSDSAASPATEKEK